MQFFGGTEVASSSATANNNSNRMRCMYIFNRNGISLYYREWLRPLTTLSPQQDQKLMFGLLFSLKSFTTKMDPLSTNKGNLGVPQLPGQGCSFHSFRTNTYKLNFMESPSGIKSQIANSRCPCMRMSVGFVLTLLKALLSFFCIILVTDPRMGDLREALRYIYNIYVEYVVKNPIYIPGQPFRCDLFNTTLDHYVRNLQ